MRQGTCIVGFAALLLGAGASAALAAGGPSPLAATAVDMGVRLYACLGEIGPRLPLAVLLPILAMSASFHVGSRLARRLPRHETRAAAAPQHPALRYAILFGLAALATLILTAAQYLGH